MIVTIKQQEEKKKIGTKRRVVKRQLNKNDRKIYWKRYKNETRSYGWELHSFVKWQ